MVEGLLVPNGHSLGLPEGQPLGVGGGGLVGGGVVGGPKGDRAIKAANVAQAENCWALTSSWWPSGPALGPFGLLDGEGQHKFRSNWSSLQLQPVD